MWLRAYCTSITSTSTSHIHCLSSTCSPSPTSKLAPWRIGAHTLTHTYIHTAIGRQQHAAIQAYMNAIYSVLHQHCLSHVSLLLSALCMPIRLSVCVCLC